MLRCCYLYAFLSLLTAADAQTLRTSVSATYVRLTGYSHQFRDAFSSCGNLGALGTTQPFSAGMYTEKRFLLNALTTLQASVVLPTTSGNFAWKGDYAGSAAYNESSAGIAYGRELGSNLAVGVQFNYFSLKAAGYGKASTVGFDAAVLLRLSSQLSAGLQASNPVGVSWGKNKGEKLPAVYTLGLGYDVSPQVFLAAEAEKTEDVPVSINAGIHYVLAEKLVARAGVRSATGLYYLGFGFQMNRFRVDVTVSVHPYLGTTPGLLLLYAEKK
ncbi:hypothetical protein HRG84_19475 [Flavisolibacter sp. BT320]|nr:hypothetical protein [Flavisolibacter longurius]